MIGMKLTIELPEELCDAIRLPEGERKGRLLLELAIGLYTSELLSLEKSADLAGTHRFTFIEALARRGLYQTYGREELAEDMAYADRCN
jgi:predicted HTH domain antitoxin